MRLKWSTFCHPKHPTFVFHDTEGVQFLEKIGSDNPRIFSYAELFVGSNGFDKDQVLGSGGFGRVYKAVLPSDGTVVAVKCLIKKGTTIEKTFAAELAAVANLRHRNLVRLRGWCVHDDQLLLVYDYMPNRSLDRVLFKQKGGNKGEAVLSWERRKRIVTGLAAALFYLHEQLETQIIHRDVKASNVMLDSNFSARLGDFGLARWLEHDFNYESTPSMKMKNQPFRLTETSKIGGTIGYLPPESFQKRAISNAKSDVFSFGIVALEIASGRRAVDLTYPDDQIILLDWIRRLSDEKSILQSVDTRLRDGSYNVSEMERLIHVGLICTSYDPQSRPTMKRVLDALSNKSLCILPDLPLFKSHPLYISLSSSPTSKTGISINTTQYTFTDSSSPTTFDSSNFVTANGKTMFQTAEDSLSINQAKYNSRQLSPVPNVETPREIAYNEILFATNNFSDTNRIAEIDFDTAYHGFLENSHHVFIKRLSLPKCPVLRTRFSNELKSIAQLRHRNLVQLRGWCTEHGEMILVYDYSPSNLLSHILFHNDRKSRGPKLQWNQRYRIIKSLASAIYYLHEEWDEQVIHGNITSSAIILDPDTSPRLGSFSLAEFLSRNEQGHNQVKQNRVARGIFGHMAPEYMKSGEATTMADVYSFGIVLLEVATGQMAVDFRFPEVLLVKKVHKFESQKRPFQELADFRLDGEYDVRELMRVIKLGIACTRSDPEARPSMKHIVSILDGFDKCFIENGQMRESTKEWKQKNVSSLALIRGMQALAIQ
ncbi:hypothetical protein LIER_04776 [Lithospermum erythrorhizon]|uniref:Protein kinase domain-containing protein n=1 Tax=Lithospermum erythrorhizon TaxID=34254 RepID=A0AAV3P2M1_LITER